MANMEKNVHTEHCCKRHGCKYMDDDCPVELGIQEQSYDCEDCGSELIEAKNIFKTLTDEERLEVMGEYCRHCGSEDNNCQCWNDE